jgi:cation diffusion facilitator CzcD-associated flavoprotein CzcO
MTDARPRTATGAIDLKHVRVAVVGAGFGGIAAAVKLRKAGLRDFVVYEKSAGPGGVWWDSRYPGAEVDTPTHMYSYSFKRYDWSRSHAQQPELQRYMEETIDEFGLREHFRFSTPVSRIVWRDELSQWEVHLADRTELFDFVVSAVGILNVPSIPDWPGLDEFAGPKFHTSRWEPEHDLAGKRVAVVGTGSTAAQVVPQLAASAKHLSVFQREPGWVNPKPVHVYTDGERARLQSPWRYRLQRIKAYRTSAGSRHGGDIHRPGTAANEAAVKACEAYIANTFADRPDLRAMVTPTYAYFGKRPIKDSSFYEALKRDNVELVPTPVTRVTRTGVVDAAGVEHEVDVLVMSTGFKPSSFLTQLGVTGRGGVDIQTAWKGEPAAYLGMTVPGFPNFFMMYGPNTNGPTIVFFHERQADFFVRAIRLAVRRRAEIEVRPSVYRRYNDWLQSKMRGSVWESANNYFKSETGKVVTQWPVSPTTYWLLSRTTMRLSSRLTRSRSAR